MRPYSDSRACPKCGHPYVRTSYRPERPGLLSYWELASDPEQAEHIRRSCERCAYEWNEAVLMAGGVS